MPSARNNGIMVCIKARQKSPLIPSIWTCNISPAITSNIDSLITTATLNTATFLGYNNE